jgi:hypothetical protein
MEINMPRYNFFSGYSKQWIVPEGILELKIDALTELIKPEFLLRTSEKTQAIPLSDVVGIPQEILKQPQLLAKFVENTYFKLSSLNDGTYKLYVNQRLLGGGNIEPNPERLWPNAIVPYRINTAKFPVGSPKYLIIQSALDAWSEADTGFQFIQRNDENDYVEFDWNENKSHSCLRNVENCSVCESHVGKKNGKQAINCDVLGTNNFNTGSVIHEIGHVIGLYHEHQRHDRNDIVKVENIVATEAPQNYEEEGEIEGAYDLESIMHYPFDGEMKIKSRIPPTQHQQIVELSKDARGREGSKPLGGNQYLIDGNLAGSTDIWEGVFKVGNQQRLSPGDIAAARHLANLSKNPATFRNHAQNLLDHRDQEDYFTKAFIYFETAGNVSLAQGLGNDWRSVYGKAQILFQNRRFEVARQMLLTIPNDNSVSNELKRLVQRLFQQLPPPQVDHEANLHNIGVRW